MLVFDFCFFLGCCDLFKVYGFAFCGMVVHVWIVLVLFLCDLLDGVHFGGVFCLSLSGCVCVGLMLCLFFGFLFLLVGFVVFFFFFVCVCWWGRYFVVGESFVVCFVLVFLCCFVSLFFFCLFGYFVILVLLYCLLWCLSVYDWCVVLGGGC